jgi:hypothetical protein
MSTMGIIGIIVGGIFIFCAGWEIGWRRGSLHMALFIAQNGGRLPDASRLKVPTWKEFREAQRR